MTEVNVFWQAGSEATINAAGGTMAGAINCPFGRRVLYRRQQLANDAGSEALALNRSLTTVNKHINLPAP